MSKSDPAYVVAGADLLISIFTKLNAALVAMGGSAEHLYRLTTPEGDDTIEAMAKSIFYADGGILSRRVFLLADNTPEVRAFNWLAREGIKTVGDLLRRTGAELMTIPGIGPKSLAIVEAKLAQYGLKLREGESDLGWRWRSLRM